MTIEERTGPGPVPAPELPLEPLPSQEAGQARRIYFHGASRPLLEIQAANVFLILITLGFYYPFFQYKQSLFMISHSCFGNRNFSFDGKGRSSIRSTPGPRSDSSPIFSSFFF